MSLAGDSSTSPSTGPGMPADMGTSKGGLTPVATPSAQPWKWPVNFTSFGRPVSARASRMARCVASVPDIVNRTISARGDELGDPVGPLDLELVARAVVGAQAHLALTASTIAGWEWPRNSAPWPIQ